MDKYIRKKIEIAKTLIYNPDVTNCDIEKEIRNLEKIRRSFDHVEVRFNDVLAKMYYAIGNYKSALWNYNQILTVNNTYPPAFLGCFKCYIAIGDIDNARLCLDAYKECVEDKSLDTTLIDYLFNYVNNGIDLNLENTNRYLWFDINEEVNDLYQILIKYINNKDFKLASEIAVKMNNISEENKYFVEFLTLSNLLKICDDIKYRRVSENKIELVKKLNIAIDNKDAEKIKEILNLIKVIDIRNPRLLIRALYVLISNGYIEDATYLLETIEIPKNYKEQVKLLKKGVTEYILLNALSTEEKVVYDEAIKKGRIAYHAKDFEEAYDYYSWGLAATDAPIFYYYLGKILFKAGHFKLAKEYLEKYVSVGLIKADKAYLYLCKISEKYGKKKKSVDYSRNIAYANDVLNKDFEFYSIYETDKDFDFVKNNAQKQMYINEIYFTHPKFDLMRYYIALVKNGNINEAEEMLDELLHKNDKSDDEKLVLRMIMRNKTLFENKRA